MMVKITSKSMSQNILMVVQLVILKVKPSQLVGALRVGALRIGNAMSRLKSWTWRQWPGLMQMIILMEGKTKKITYISGSIVNKNLLFLTKSFVIFKIHQLHLKKHFDLYFADKQ